MADRHWNPWTQKRSCAPSAIGALTECVRHVRRRRTGPGGDYFVGGASSRSGTDVDATTSRAESRNTVTK